MPNNDKPTDTQASQANNEASSTSTDSNNAKRATSNTKKGSQNAAKATANAKKTASLAERPKPEGSKSGNKPSAQSQPKFTKLGAFQPLRGAFDPTSGTDEWNPYESTSREFILVSAVSQISQLKTACYGRKQSLSHTPYSFFQGKDQRVALLSREKLIYLVINS